MSLMQDAKKEDTVYLHSNVSHPAATGSCPQHTHIRKKDHFKYVFDNAKMVENHLVRLYYAKAYTTKGAAAFIASKKTGNAVKRNRCKRILKEIYRSSPLRERNIDLIMSAKSKLYHCSWEKASLQISSLFSNLPHTQ